MLKERLGLFDDPYRRGSAWPHGARDAERRDLAREVGRRAIVLLDRPCGSLAALARIRRDRFDRPPGRRVARDAGAVGVGGPRSGRRVDSGRAQSRSAAMPDRHAPGVDIEGQMHRGISAAVDLCRGRRSGRDVPRRSRRDERGSGKSSRPRPAGTPARARRGGLRPRQAGRRRAFLGPPADAALVVRARRRRSCDLVSRLRSRTCGRGRVDRTIQSDRKIAAKLAARWSAKFRFLRPAPDRPPDQGWRALLEFISRCAGDAGISVWPRPVL